MRLLAAQGALAPRASDQLSILVLLDDGDPEIRTTAKDTLERIPGAAISAFLARSDATDSASANSSPDRGIARRRGARPTRDAPLVGADGRRRRVLGEDEDRESVQTQKLAAMNDAPEVEGGVQRHEGDARDSRARSEQDDLRGRDEQSKAHDWSRSKRRRWRSVSEARPADHRAQPGLDEELQSGVGPHSESRRRSRCRSTSCTG